VVTIWSTRLPVGPDGTTWLFNLSGRIGVPYLLVVPLVYVFLWRLSRFKVGRGDFFAVTAPIILYVGLLFARDRQGLNSVDGNMWIAFAVCIGLLVKASTRWSPAAHAALIAVLGCATALAAWIFIPLVPIVMFDKLW
jgi:hypothetical protein